MDKAPFWTDVTEFFSSIHLPWCLIGDFNELLQISDKRGGNRATHSRCQILSEFIFSCQARDVCSPSNVFSWRKKHNDQYIYEKLDRCFVSPQWASKYQNSFLHYDTYTCSDHAPIILSTNQERQYKPARFRFQNAWTNDPNTRKIICKYWYQQHSRSHFYNIT